MAISCGPDTFIILQSRVDAYKFYFFKNCFRLELPSQFSQINTICELLQDGPTPSIWRHH